MDKPLTSNNTKSRIVEAFWKAFETKNINHISTAEIARLAGIHRNTFYRYFNSVYDLLDYVENDLVERVVPFIDDKMVTQTEIMNAIFGNIIIEHDDHLSLVIKKDSAGYAEKYKRLLFPILQRNFNSDNRYSLDDDQITYILSGSIAMIVNYFASGEKRSADELVSKIMCFFNLICRKQ